MNTDIHKDGYIILHSVLSAEELENGSHMIDKTIDYIALKNFIDTIFFPTIIKNQSFITDPKYVKFRFSNNTNSKDASLFHGDIYNHSKIDILPIYTCLCYFDSTQMEIVPGSHLPHNDWSINSYNTKILLDIQPGDILIFHANIHHRGTNFDKEGNRRLLQVFDVFPDANTYNKHSPKLVIVKPKKTPTIAASILYEVSKHPTIIDTLSFFHYILMYNDLQYKWAFNDISPSDKKDKYVSYEPNERKFVEDVQIYNENVNIICDKTITTIPYSNYYIYIAILYLIITILIVYIIYELIQYRSRRFRFFRDLSFS